MPYHSKTPTLLRQWEMMKKIPGRPPGISAGELTQWLDRQGYPVSKRTVERDLNDLSAAFGLTCEQQGKIQKWYWLPNRQPEFGGIELSDAASLLLAKDLLQALLPASMLKALEPKFKQAAKALKEGGANRHARWAEKLRYQHATYPFQPPRIPPRVLDSVHHALLQEKQLRLRYTAPGATSPKDLTLHPLGIVQQAHTPYLVATAFSYTDPRLYALHRMERVEVTPEPIQPPPGFSLEDYLQSGAMEFGDQSIITLKARVSTRLATYLAETPLEPDQKITYRNGAYRIYARVHDSWKLHLWILAQGDQITIESPAALRRRIRDIHQSAYENYSAQ